MVDVDEALSPVRLPVEDGGASGPATVVVTLVRPSREAGRPTSTSQAGSPVNVEKCPVHRQAGSLICPR